MLKYIRYSLREDMAAELEKIEKKMGEEREEMRKQLVEIKDK